MALLSNHSLFLSLLELILVSRSQTLSQGGGEGGGGRGGKESGPDIPCFV